MTWRKYFWRVPPRTPKAGNFWGLGISIYIYMQFPKRDLRLVLFSQYLSQTLASALLIKILNNPNLFFLFSPPILQQQITMKGGSSKADSRNSDGKLGVRKRKQKREKKAKDPNKPKRPPSAFFVFMEEFRKQFKEENPNNKSVAVVGKAGGDRWKSFTDEERAPYVAKAEKRKEEYERQMQAYNRRLEGGRGEEESDKSKSEVNDEEEEGGSGEEDEDDE